MKNDDLEIYEVGFHILPNVAEFDLETEFSKIKDLILEKEGTVITEEYPVLINLAYEISKKIETKNMHFDKAYFGFIKFEIVRENISEIKNKLDGFKNILRFLIIKTVRENTIFTPKQQLFKKDNKNSVVVNEEDKVDIDEEAEVLIDKSIDELVI